MRLTDKVLVHQVHPAKVAADVTASLVSNVLLWKGLNRSAVAFRVLLPVLGSAAVLALADLDDLATTRRGRYVLTKMPPAAQAVRLAGDVVMAWGARRHSRSLLVIGGAGIVAGWAYVPGIAGVSRVMAQRDA